MTIAIQQEEQGGFRVLVLSGRLDTETSADLELALSDLQAAGANHFVIDLAQIGYVSSAGLRVLLALAKQLEGGRGILRLCGLNGTVQEVFDVAGFSRMFAIFPTRDAALGAATPAGAKAAAKTAPKPAESELAKQAAALLGAGESSATPSADSADLARSAAQLLGAGPKPARDADSKPAPAPKPPPPPAAAAPEKESPGVLGKFRNLFGKK